MTKCIYLSLKEAIIGALLLESITAILEALEEGTFNDTNKSNLDSNNSKCHNAIFLINITKDGYDNSSDNLLLCANKEDNSIVAKVGNNVNDASAHVNITNEATNNKDSNSILFTYY